MGRKDLARAVLAAGLLLVFPACKPPAKNVLRIELPIDCVPQETCWIAKFVDTDPGPGVMDFMCTSRGRAR